MSMSVFFLTVQNSIWSSYLHQVASVIPLVWNLRDLKFLQDPYLETFHSISHFLSYPQSLSYFFELALSSCTTSRHSFSFSHQEFIVLGLMTFISFSITMMVSSMGSSHHIFMMFSLSGFSPIVLTILSIKYCAHWDLKGPYGLPF